MPRLFALKDRAKPDGKRKNRSFDELDGKGNDRISCGWHDMTPNAGTDQFTGW
ncbi:MAG: hypothetical protein P8O85_04585 [Yoonia sp.]|nr:hypothetical protein [Yoonia sp.]